MLSANGWFRFPRRLFEHQAWLSASPAVWRVLTASYCLANYEPGFWFDGRKRVSVPAGSFVTSRAKMCAFCSITEKQFRNAVEFLELHGLIKTNGANRWTMISLLECADYEDSSAEMGQGPGERPEKGQQQGQEKGQQRGQEVSRLTDSIEMAYCDDAGRKGQHKGQEKGQQIGDLGASSGATIEERRIEKEEGEGEGSPILEEVFPHLAIVPPPPSPTGSEPAALIEHLVRDLGKVHPGPVSVPHAIQDAAAAFRRSGETDLAAWCLRAREAHSEWKLARPWVNQRRVAKALGYWFADDEHKRFAPRGQDGSVTESFQESRPARGSGDLRTGGDPMCQQCDDRGWLTPEELPNRAPGMKLQAYQELCFAMRVPCSCQSTASEAVSA